MTRVCCTNKQSTGFDSQLLGASKYTYKTRNFKETVKTGTFQKAKADYEKLKPTVLASSKGGKKIGMVGNNIVTLTHKGQAGSKTHLKAELRIYKNPTKDSVDIESIKYFTE